MRRVLVGSTVLLLLGLAAALLVRFYEPAQLVLMWIIWLGAAGLIFVAGLCGLLH